MYTLRIYKWGSASLRDLTTLHSMLLLLLLLHHLILLLLLLLLLLDDHVDLHDDDDDVDVDVDDDDDDDDDDVDADVDVFITSMRDVYNCTPEQTIFLGYTALQLFCIYNLCHM